MGNFIRKSKSHNINKKKLEKENKLSLEEYNDLMDSEKISWNELSSNPNAIKLLKERKIYEDTLSKTAYDNLNNKINWKKLSQNPSIFTIS